MGEFQDAQIRRNQTTKTGLIELFKKLLHTGLARAVPVKIHRQLGNKGNGQEIGHQQGNDQGGDQGAEDVLRKVPDEHQGKHDHDGGDSAGEHRRQDFPGAFLNGGIQILVHLSQVALDVFQHHHGIVHQHSQGQDDGCVHDNIQLTPGQVDDRHGAEEHQGNGQARGNDRPEIPQKEQQHDEGIDDGIPQCFQHIGIGGLDKIALGVTDLEVDTRVLGLENLQFPARRLTHIQHTAAGSTLNRQGNA